MNEISPFHLAIPVDNLDLCRNFYGKVLGCQEGRSSNHWVDFNFFGHQLVIHQRPEGDKAPNKVHKTHLNHAFEKMFLQFLHQHV